MANIDPILRWTRYLTGPWEAQLPGQLLYYSHTANGRRPQGYRAPSWSWASVVGANVEFALPNIPTGYSGPSYEADDRVGALKILEAHYSPTGSDLTGRVSDGFLKVSGLVVQAVVGETSPASNIWQMSRHWPKQPQEIQNVKFFMDAP